MNPAFRTGSKLSGLFLLWLHVAFLSDALGQAPVPASTAPASYSREPGCCPTVTAPYRPLGTFNPQPYVFVPSNGISGGNYSPLGIWNAGTLAEYGPLSMQRQVAVPVEVYTRGYDGVVQPSSGTALMYPNMPAWNPANGRAAIAFPPSRRPYRPFRAGAPAINWIDQN